MPMNELIDILKAHHQRYPLMMPQDVVKLIYQNEFGGGHLIKDKNLSLIRLEEEYASIQVNNEEEMIPIGNGLVRVSLHTYKRSLQELNEAFVLSSSMVEGSKEKFFNKIDKVKEWIIKENIFSFTKEEFIFYLDEYVNEGCNLVSHSDVYRKYYHPSYRVILKELL